MVDFDLRVKFWIKQELEIRFGSEMGQMASIPTNTPWVLSYKIGKDLDYWD